MVTLRQKPAGQIGLPANTKDTGKRVDFKVDDFSVALETKGYRLVWKRAIYCPCTPVNDQTEQPDPNCTLCEGSGWLLFMPSAAVTDKKVIGSLDALQTSLSLEGAVIKGIMTGVAAHDTPYDQAMRRIEGTTNITVRAENKLGYHDQLVNLDASIVYSQMVTMEDNLTLTTGRGSGKVTYPIVEMNLLRSAAQVYTQGTDFNITSGQVEWVTGQQPNSGTILGLHYLTYPHWRVIEHPHMTRHTLVKFKSKKPTTPLGDPTDLPVQAICKLEFL